ncbi:MAG: pitrilysin family protein [Elusimicrobiota bacterium]
MKHLPIALITLLLSASAHADQGRLATEQDRAQPVVIGPMPAFALKQAAKAALANGLTLSLIENHHLPHVAVTLVIPKAGDASDPIGREGLAQFAADLSLEGVAKLPTAAALGDAIDQIGASIEVSSDNSGLTYSVYVLKKNMGKAMALVSKMLLSPSYVSKEPQYDEALERMRQQALAGLEMEKGNPTTLVSKHMAASLFGNEPHGRFPTENSLHSLSLNGVVEHRRNALSPAGAVLAVAGDVTLEELKSLAEKNFGSWTLPGQSGAPAAPLGLKLVEERSLAGRAALSSGLAIDVIDMPGEQAELMLAVRSLPRLHPDHDSLSMAVFVLGGPMIGRLDQNIRETRGWAYGARASMKAWKEAGMVTLSTKIQLDKTGEALREILLEVQRLSDSPVPDSELLAAKTFVIGNYLRNSGSVKTVSSRLAAAEILGLPASSLTDYAERMGAVTPAQIQDASKAWLDASKLKIVIAGPAAAIVPQLKGFGTVQIYDVEGRPKTASNG